MALKDWLGYPGMGEDENMRTMVGLMKEQAKQHATIAASMTVISENVRLLAEAVKNLSGRVSRLERLASGVQDSQIDQFLNHQQGHKKLS